MNQKLDFFTSYVTEAPRLMHTGGDKKKKKSYEENSWDLISLTQCISTQNTDGIQRKTAFPSGSRTTIR